MILPGITLVFLVRFSRPTLTPGLLVVGIFVRLSDSGSVFKTRHAQFHGIFPAASVIACDATFTGPGF